MALPAHVQKQLDQANSLLEQINAPPAPSLETAAPEPVTPPAADPVESVAVEPPPKPVEDWQQKYKSLDGVIRSRDARLAQVTGELEQVKKELQRISAEKAKPVEAAIPESDNAEDVAAFGEDLRDFIRRTSSRSSSLAMAPFEARVKALEQRMEGTDGAVARGAENTFFMLLAKEVPDWDAINASDEFLAWLSEADPVYGVPRQAALKLAQDNQDVGRVARIFNTFKEGRVPPVAPKHDSLSKQAAPRAAASAPPQGPDTSIITQAEVQAFYKDVAQGRYRGNEARQQQLESAINAAMAEGRIR